MFQTESNIVIIMGSDNTSYHSKSEFYYPNEDFRYLRPFHSNLVGKKKHVTCRSQSVHIGKKCALALEYGYWPHMQDLAHFFPIQTSRMANISYNCWVNTNLSTLLSCEIAFKANYKKSLISAEDKRLLKGKCTCRTQKTNCSPQFAFAFSHTCVCVFQHSFLPAFLQTSG